MVQFESSSNHGETIWLKLTKTIVSTEMNDTDEVVDECYTYQVKQPRTFRAQTPLMTYKKISITYIVYCFCWGYSEVGDTLTVRLLSVVV